MAKNVRYTTNAGVAKYPWLNKPDTKFDSDGVYKVDLAFDKKSDIAELHKLCTEAVKDAAIRNKTKKMAKLPIFEEVDDQENKTGRWIVRCKVKCRPDWDRKPKLFDASGKRIDVNVGGGTVMKVNLELYVWSTPKDGVGITLQPRAIQIIDLVEFESGGSAETYGFGEEEGFVSDEELDGTEEGHKKASEVSKSDEDEDLF